MHPKFKKIESLMFEFSKILTLKFYSKSHTNC